MSTLGIIALIFLFLTVGVPVARALGDRLAGVIEGRRQSPPAGLEHELEETRAQLARTADRLGQIEARLDFYERLLEKRGVARLEAGGEAPPEDPTYRTDSHGLDGGE